MARIAERLGGVRRVSLSLAILFLGCASDPLPDAGSEPSSAPKGPFGGAARLYFPNDNFDWERIEPAAASWDAEALSNAVDYVKRQGSSGFVVLVGGRLLVAESWVVEGASDRYSRLKVGQSRDGWAIEDVASVQKSVVAMLLALAEEKGLLDLDAPVSEHLGVGWSRAEAEQEGAITLRHLASMSSGLDDALPCW